MIIPLRSLLAILALLLVAGCGQMITRPTPPAPPAATATPTAALPPTAPPTTAPPANTPANAPAPYTPEPTPTPTLTPTPIIHTIQSGETLIALAGRYGVSVQAIQETNGIIDPRALRIGQQLIIPGEAEDRLDAGTPTPAPTPLPLQIGPITFGNAADGSLWALGEVFNPGPEPVEGVRLRLTLANAQGAALATLETPIQADVLAAGARAPFGAPFPDPPAAGFRNYFVETVQALPAYLGSVYLDLAVADVEEEAQRYYAHRLRGVVRNTGPEEAVEVQVVITLYDALDQVISFRRVQPQHILLPPGGETPFETELILLGGPVARSALFATGRRILPTPTP